MTRLNGLFTTVLDVRMGIEGILEAYLDLVLSCYSVGFIFGTRIFYWFVNRVRHMRSIAALAALPHAPLS